MEKTTADKYIEIALREKITKQRPDYPESIIQVVVSASMKRKYSGTTKGVLIRAIELAAKSNSLVSESDEDNEPRHHISCVNCAIEWARQYETDNEIAKRVYFFFHKDRYPKLADDFLDTGDEFMDWLNKEGE